MRIKLSKSAARFLEKCTENDKNRIKNKIKSLYNFLMQSGTIPYKQLDIKRLEGEWKDLLRMRIGRIRVVFYIDQIEKEIEIYEIDFRGNLYK